MPKEETTTRFKVDISELKAGIQEANRQIRLANSEFKAATSGMDDWSKSADGISAKLKQLNDVLTLEKQKLANLEEQYALVVKEQGENSKGAEELRIKINNQKAAVGNVEKQIRTYTDQLDHMGDETQEVTQETEKSSEGFTVMKGVLADLIASGIKAAIGALKDMAAAAKEAYTEFDSGYDNLIKATGATGETAKDLEKSYANVAKAVVGDMQSIGSAVGEVNTRFGYTGEELEKASEKFMKFADITGTDATKAVQLVSRAMGDAGIESSDYASVLDDLAIANQASGISVDKLTELLTKYGAPMRALGFDTKGSIAIFSQWEKAGVNTEIAFSGMKNAISKWSAEGKDAKQEFKKTLEVIASSPDIASATTQAIEIFGKKAGPDLADAIKGGRFEYSDFLAVLESSGGTVEKTYAQTQDGFDKIKLAAQSLKVGAGEAFKSLLDEYSPEIDAFIEKAQAFLTGALSYVTETLVPNVKELFDWASEHLPEIEALVAGIAAAFLAWQVASVITTITTALAGMSAAEVIAAAQTWLLNTALLSNPIAIVVAAIAALVAAIIVLYKRSEWFRKKVKAIGDFFIALCGTITDYGKKVFDFYMDLLEKIANGFSAVVSYWSDLFTRGFLAVKKAWDDAPAFFEMIWDSIKDVFSGVVTFWSDLFTRGFMAIKDAWDGVTDFFSDTWESIKDVFSGAADFWSDLFSQSFTAIKSAWSGVTDFFSDTWEGIKDVHTDTVDFWSDLFTRGFMAIKDAWDGVTDFFSTVWESIKDAYADTADFWSDLLLLWLMVIKDVWSGVPDFFSEVWDGIKDAFSPAKAFFAEKFSAAYDAMRNVWNKAEGYFISVWNDIKRAFSSAQNWFGDIFRGAWDAVKSAFSGVGSFFGGIFDTIKGKFSSIGTAVGEAIGGAFKKVINSVIKTVEDTLNFLPSHVNPLLQTITDITNQALPLFPTVSLPRLAKGGVVDRSILANLGEDGAEAVVPLERNTQWLDEVAKRLSASMSGSAAYAYAGAGGAPVTNVTNNFYQTNNSPKALSRLEIYRQSKNLLGMKR